jgi:hypothetical protein
MRHGTTSRREPFESEDFDEVVFGISLAGVPYVCRELLSGNELARHGRPC